MLHPTHGSRRRGAVETRRPMGGDGLVQEDDVVCVMVASMAERPGKVDASVFDLRMDRWMEEVPTESAPDRCVTQSKYCDLDRASDIRC